MSKVVNKKKEKEKASSAQNSLRVAMQSVGNERRSGVVFPLARAKDLRLTCSITAPA